MERKPVTECDMVNCDPKVVATLARFEEKWKQQIKCNKKIDDIHTILCGNGKEGLDDQVRANTRFRKGFIRLMWILATGIVLSGVGFALGAIF
jgi:hypothetical protein